MTDLLQDAILQALCALAEDGAPTTASIQVPVGHALDGASMSLHVWATTTRPPAVVRIESRETAEVRRLLDELSQRMAAFRCTVPA